MHAAMLCRLSALQLDWHGASQWALSELIVFSGQCIWLQGENGVGKSTWMRATVGLLPTSGRVYWAKRYCLQLALQPEFFFLWQSSYRMEEKVASVIAREYAVRTGEVLSRQALRRFCDGTALLSCLDLRWGQLSQGQRQWVFLLPCAYINAAVWLLDEPYVFLDIQHKIWLDACIRRHLLSGGSVIISSHERPYDAQKAVRLLLSRRAADA